MNGKRMVCESVFYSKVLTQNLKLLFKERGGVEKNKTQYFRGGYSDY
jgi:hypothetical protein